MAKDFASTEELVQEVVEWANKNPGTHPPPEYDMYMKWLLATDLTEEQLDNLCKALRPLNEYEAQFVNESRTLTDQLFDKRNKMRSTLPGSHRDR